MWPFRGQLQPSFNPRFEIKETVGEIEFVIRYFGTYWILSLKNIRTGTIYSESPNLIPRDKQVNEQILRQIADYTRILLESNTIPRKVYAEVQRFCSNQIIPTLPENNQAPIGSSQEFKVAVNSTNYTISVKIVGSNWELGILNTRRGNCYSEPAILFSPTSPNAVDRARNVFNLTIQYIKEGQNPRQCYASIFAQINQGKI